MHAARSNHRNRNGTGKFRGRRGINARQHPVTADVGVKKRLHAEIFKAPGKVFHLVPRALDPAVGGDNTVFGVKRRDDVAGKGRAGFT